MRPSKTALVSFSKFNNDSFLTFFWVDLHQGSSLCMLVDKKPHLLLTSATTEEKISSIII